MSGPTLSQSEIDHLLSNVRQKASTVDTDHATTFDFRTPSKFPTTFVREFVELHKAFTRILSDALTRELRTPVTVEVTGTEQLSYDSYIRSMPNPSILTIIALEPLPGLAVIEMSPQLGLVLVDRMLGGPGRPIAPRQPTQLEQTLLGVILAHPMSALKDTFEGVVDVTPAFVNSELNPAFAHAATPTEMVLVITFSLVAESTGPSARGLLSICYPLTILTPIRDGMRQARWSGGASTAEKDTTVMTSILQDAPVSVAIHTRPTEVSASSLVGLSPGDVVMLDHAVDEAFVGSIEDIPFMRARLGRQGPDLAAQVENWI